MSLKAKLSAALLAEKAVKNCLFCYGLQAEIEKHVREAGVSKNLASVLKHLTTCQQCRSKNLQIIAHAKEGHP